MARPRARRTTSRPWVLDLPGERVIVSTYGDESRVVVEIIKSGILAGAMLTKEQARELAERLLRAADRCDSTMPRSSDNPENKPSD